MKVVAISDLHGYLPEIPACDLLLIAGDICPIRDHSIHGQVTFLNNEFREWLEEIPAAQVVGIAGNHDLIFERQAQMIPQSLRWIYLLDQMTKVGEMSIYGSPWQLPFYDWAFNLPEAELAKKWSVIPEGIDIILTHGPPTGFGDVTMNGDKAGSQSLIDVIARTRPRLVVFGHIHEGRGRWTFTNPDGSVTQLANATVLDEKYQPAYKPMIFEM
jgi:Icc-related predicted phosphoesterase